MKRTASSQSTHDSLSFDDKDNEEWADLPKFSDPHLPLAESAPIAHGSSSPESPPIIAAARSAVSKGSAGVGKMTRRKTKKGSSSSGGGDSVRAPRGSQAAAAAELQVQVQYPFLAGDTEDEEPEPERPPAQVQVQV